MQEHVLTTVSQLAKQRWEKLRLQHTTHTQSSSSSSSYSAGNLQIVVRCCTNAQYLKHFILKQAVCSRRQTVQKIQHNKRNNTSWDSGQNMWSTLKKKQNTSLHVCVLVCMQRQWLARTRHPDLYSRQQHVMHLSPLLYNSWTAHGTRRSE